MDQVYQQDKDCCGCGCCSQICPVHAIRMEENSDGYIFPIIDKEICIDCGKCRQTCTFKNPRLELPVQTYCAYRKNEKKRLHSSSGGVFAALAEVFLKDGQTVCGSVIDRDFNVKHKLISDIRELQPMLGSKYVQSDITYIYDPVKNALKDHKVLFCGTPCQVSALKNYIGENDNLYTIDIICHGTPPNKIFKAYMQCEYPDAKGYIFRDKKQGWSFDACVIQKNGRSKVVKHRNSAYMSTYFNAVFYRESCFACPFAGEQRCGDFTIGDYWGVLKHYPKVAQDVDIDKGISCLLVNNERGEQLLCKTDLVRIPVLYEHIKEGNGPLNKPSEYNKMVRNAYLHMWRKDYDWADVEAYWKKHDRKLRYVLWAYMPKGIKNRLRILFGLR